MQRRTEAKDAVLAVFWPASTCRKETSPCGQFFSGCAVFRPHTNEIVPREKWRRLDRCPTFAPCREKVQPSRRGRRLIGLDFRDWSCDTLRAQRRSRALFFSLACAALRCAAPGPPCKSSLYSSTTPALTAGSPFFLHPFPYARSGSVQSQVALQALSFPPNTRGFIYTLHPRHDQPRPTPAHVATHVPTPHLEPR